MDSKCRSASMIKFIGFAIRGSPAVKVNLDGESSKFRCYLPLFARYFNLCAFVSLVRHDKSLTLSHIILGKKKRN